MGYARPAAKNFCAVDALLPAMDILLQMTICKKHPVKTHGIRKCLRRVASGGESAAEIKEVKLVFVVPDYRFPDFQKQAFVNKKPGSSKADSEATEDQADQTDDDDEDFVQQDDVDELIPDSLLSVHPPKNVSQYVLEIRISNPSC